MVNKKVSIILIHYNQSGYVKEALSSIFKQTYKNIELIFADDASSDLELNDLKEYCKENNKKNFDIIWQINKQNVGTVKNVNNAVKKSKGDYILIFAADDALCSNDVIRKFVDFFEVQDDDVAMVFGQCFMMDKNLENIEYNFIDFKRGMDFNQLSSLEQFEFLSTECFIAMGASMIKTSILKKVGLFDEKYKYIEDWPLFLSLTNKNYRLLYNNNIDALFHRDGGISHRDINIEPKPHHIEFEKDLLNIMVNEIFPKFSNFSYEKKCEILSLYKIRVNNLKRYGVEISKTNWYRLIKQNFCFFIKRKLEFININYVNYREKYLNKCNRNLIFIVGFYVLNEFFEKKFNLIFQIIISFLIIIFACNISVYILNFINRFFHKLKKK